MDDPRAVAFDESAPAAERYDARLAITKAGLSSSLQLVPTDDIRRVIDHINGAFADQDIAKAASRQLMPGRSSPPPARGMRSVQLDDLQVTAMGQYWEKPATLGFDSMKSMVEQTPILNAIVMTRQRQINRFCQMSEDGGPGFEIRHRDRSHKMTSSETEAAMALGRFFTNCGWEFNPRRRKALKRDNFTQFMAKSVRDSLTMDSAPIETEMKRDRSLGIDGFYAVDGSTIRLCTEDGFDGDEAIVALQVIEGRIATSYDWNQLIYEVRNPRADVRIAGYGLGEPELLIRVVTGFLNAMTYNIKGFDSNSIPKGLLHLSGNYSSEDLSAFKRNWNATLMGVQNAHKLPVLVSADQESKASFEKFGVEFDEMAFAKWISFLTAAACAIYGMDPSEINFDSFSGGNTSSLAGNDTAEKLANSKDKGLRPLMSYYEATFSDFIVSSFSDDLCFRWKGLDEEDPKDVWERTKTVATVDEIRAQDGLDPMKDKDLGALPVNPALIQVVTQRQQMQAQSEQQAGQQEAARPKEFGPAAPEQEEEGDFGQPDDEEAPGGQDFGGQKPGGDFGGGPAGDNQGADDGAPQTDDDDVTKGLTIFVIGGP